MALAMLLHLFSISANAETTLLLGVHPYKAVDKLQKAYQPLADLLASKLGRTVNLNIAKDYQTHIELVGNDQLDIAYLGPASYIEMVEQFGNKRILARQVVNDEPTFKGKIITRSDSGIKQLADLEGKRFAFGDPNSTMSHLVPRYMLIKNGISKDKLQSFSFLGSHDNVAIGVLSGNFDAGAVKEAVYHKYKDKGLTSLASTEALSEHLFVASNRLPQVLVDNIKKILLDLKNHQAGRDIMNGIKKNMNAMAEARDEDYDNLRNILSVLKQRKIIE
ncbi:MAG: phosphate/phosphite/phosphonate ABC transporter substrate-binding protein [Thioalkalispiraceae bacterium]|jgi:phosphonate transport system substrate-binding protein